MHASGREGEIVRLLRQGIGLRLLSSARGVLRGAQKLPLCNLWGASFFEKCTSHENRNFIKTSISPQQNPLSGQGGALKTAFLDRFSGAPLLTTRAHFFVSRFSCL